MTTAKQRAAQYDNEAISRAVAELNRFSWMQHEDEIIAHYWPKVREWIEAGMTKPAHIAFTAGLGRVVAGLVEDGIRKSKELAK